MEEFERTATDQVLPLRSLQIARKRRVPCLSMEPKDEMVISLKLDELPKSIGLSPISSKTFEKKVK